MSKHYSNKTNRNINSHQTDHMDYLAVRFGNDFQNCTGHPDFDGSEAYLGESAQDFIADFASKHSFGGEYNG